MARAARDGPDPWIVLDASLDAEERALAGPEARWTRSDDDDDDDDGAPPPPPPPREEKRPKKKQKKTKRDDDDDDAPRSFIETMLASNVGKVRQYQDGGKAAAELAAAEEEDDDEEDDEEVSGDGDEKRPPREPTRPKQTPTRTGVVKIVDVVKASKRKIGETFGLEAIRAATFGEDALGGGGGGGW